MINDFDELSLQLRKIYKDSSDDEINSIFSKVNDILDVYTRESRANVRNSDYLWDSSTCVLITYADVVCRKGESSLKTLSDILDEKFYNLSKVVHILPFLKSTSDGGFAVSSFNEIETRFGDWEDIKLFSKNHLIMADLVINHVSASHQWVADFINNNKPGVSYIISPKDKLGWDKVVRPRSSPLFTYINTKRGFLPVWTTFGPDQIDVNWSNPEIIIEFLNLIIRYFNNKVV